jgi:hypothetical protein
VLSTGDFRYTENIFIDSSLCRLTEPVDIVYLDNTYNSKLYQNIPSREIAFNEIRLLIEKYYTQAKSPQRYFILKYKRLGKEKLLIGLANYFKCKIYVSKDRYNLYMKVLNMHAEYFAPKAAHLSTDKQLGIIIEVQDYDDTNNVEKQLRPVYICKYY